MSRWVNLEKEVTLADYLIAFLCSARSTMAFYRIMRERVLTRRKARSVSATLGRLRKNGLVKSGKSGWSITETGREYYKNRERLSFIPSPFPDKALDSLVISFDIPEKERYLRSWLRTQLKIFGYHMIQQSLWTGPGPLPHVFREKMGDLGIKDKIKIFKLRPKN